MVFRTLKPHLADTTWEKMKDQLPLIYINERFNAWNRTAAEMDEMWDDGWRHFGTLFFRYSLTIHHEDLQHVIPMRIRLAGLKLSQSQRRVLNKNADLRIEVRPAEVTPEKEAMFDRHKARFKHDVPDSIYNFLSLAPATVPCTTSELCVYKGDELLAVTFLGIGNRSNSATYAMFEPRESARSLGIYMILKEAEYSIETGKEFLHLGYAYDGPSFYDYKKRFSGLEAFDWQGNWKPFERE